MLGAYWHLHHCIDFFHFVCGLLVARWAAESTSSASRDTYCRAPPQGSVCRISPGLAPSQPASVSACSLCSNYILTSLVVVFHYSFWHLVAAYPHCRLLQTPCFCFSSTLSNFSHSLNPAITSGLPVDCSLPLNQPAIILRRYWTLWSLSFCLNSPKSRPTPNYGRVV